MESVASVQARLTPSRGKLSISDIESSQRTPPDESSSNYSCHRIKPLFQKEAEKSEASASLSSLLMGSKGGTEGVKSLGSLFASPTTDLFNVVREACAHQNVKWPVECQVASPAIHHIIDWPLYPEPFYHPTGTELRPQPVGDETGRVVYHYNPTSAVNYFSRSCVGGNKHVSDDVRVPLTSPEDTTLMFESRFESGNLAKVIQVSECYYELHIRSDLYTARHTQWYYFAVSNTRRNITYRFSIVNFMKGDSLYNHGLKPLLYSTTEAHSHGIGWRRCANNIVYFRNQDRYEPSCIESDEDCEEEPSSYTLTFNVSFPHDQDTVYLTHCYPYTFSLLQHHLLAVQNDSNKSGLCRQRVLCRTLAGNPVYLLTITSNLPEDEGKKKRAIVLSARVHPGETPSSWIMKGAIDFLTSDNPRAAELRRQFVFKVIPMINPDGVIVGNHRCSLSARDLNRQYKMVSKEMFPPVWHIKAMIRKLMDEHGVVMYCDFHAHSRKHNTFIYGCENRRNNENHLREQIFPLLLHYNAGDKFSFKGCKFRIHRSKEGTARIVVWMMGVLHSYTLEASFGGATHGTRAHTHFTLMDFTTLGKQFCETLHTYFDPLPVKEKLRHKVWSRLIKKGSNADEPTAVDLSDSNSSSGESEKLTSSFRLKKKKGNSKFGGKKKAGSRMSSAVEKLSRQIRLEKNANEGTDTIHSHLSSPDVGRAYVYDPNTLTLVRQNQSTSSLDHDDRRKTNDPEDTIPKPRKVKGSRKQRPCSSRSPRSNSAEVTAKHSVKSVVENHLKEERKLSLRADEGEALESSPGTLKRVVALSLMPPPDTDIARKEGALGESGEELLKDQQTKTYMERMTEVTARLTVSDNEDDSLHVFWDQERSHRRNSNSNLGKIKASPRSRSIKSGLSIEGESTLAPIVGRNLLADPKRTTLLLAPRERGRAVLVNGNTLHRSLTSLHAPEDDRARPRLSSSPPGNPRLKKVDRYLQLPQQTNKFVIRKNNDDETLPPLAIGHKQHTRNLNSVNVKIIQGELEEGDATYQISHSRDGNLNITSIPNAPLTVQYDSVVEPDSYNMSINKNLTKVQNDNACESSSSDSGYKSKSVSLRTTKLGAKNGAQITKLRKTSNWEDDDTHMYGDIEKSDTLFLDIGTKDAPELMAARNIKGKLKKKKIVKQKSKSIDEVEKQDKVGGLTPGNDVSVTLEKGSNESEQATVKVRKKIKIVIGKRPKGRISRKKSITD